MTRLAILGSGKGSNCRAIAQAVREGLLPAEIALVVADHPEAGILEVAREYGLPAISHPTGPYKTRLGEAEEQALSRLLQEHEIDWLVLAGWMRVVKAPLLEAFPDRIVNIHPSLLPRHPGLAAWKQAFEAGDAITGCTVHRVDAGVDTGAIVAQAEVPRLSEDTPETLHARIQEAEHWLYPAALRQLITAT